MYFHNISIFRKKTYVSMLASEYNLCQSCSSSQKINFCWKYSQTLISHNLGTSDQNLEKISGIHIDNKRETKYVKMKDFWKNHYSMLSNSYKNVSTLSVKWFKRLLNNTIKSNFENSEIRDLAPTFWNFIRGKSS